MIEPYCFNAQSHSRWYQRLFHCVCPLTLPPPPPPVIEHRMHALKNGDVQTFHLAEHVFKTRHAVDLSQSEVLDHHQHTNTHCMLENWCIQHNQGVLNKERGTLPKVYVALLD